MRKNKSRLIVLACCLIMLAGLVSKSKAFQTEPDFMGDRTPVRVGNVTILTCNCEETEDENCGCWRGEI